MKKMFFGVACFVGLSVLGGVSFGSIDAEAAWNGGGSVGGIVGNMIPKTITVVYPNTASIPGSYYYKYYSNNRWWGGNLSLISTQRVSNGWRATFRGVTSPL